MQDNVLQPVPTGVAAHVSSKLHNSGAVCMSMASLLFKSHRIRHFAIRFTIEKP